MIRHRYTCDYCGRIDELVELPKIPYVLNSDGYIPEAGVPGGWVQIEDSGNDTTADRWKQFCQPEHRELWLEQKRLYDPAAGDRQHF